MRGEGFFKNARIRCDFLLIFPIYGMIHGVCARRKERRVTGNPGPGLCRSVPGGGGDGKVLPRVSMRESFCARRKGEREKNIGINPGNSGEEFPEAEAA